jgi:hypothetical protein
MMPVYAWEAITVDRAGKEYRLRGSFYIEDRSTRVADAKARRDIHERHNGSWVVIQDYDLELVDGD